MYHARIPAVFIGEQAAKVIEAYDDMGDAPDLSGITMTLTITNAAGAVVQTVADGSLTKSNAATGKIGFTTSAATTSTERRLNLAIRNASTGQVLVSGQFTVQYAAGA